LIQPSNKRGHSDGGEVAARGFAGFADRRIGVEMKKGHGKPLEKGDLSS